MLTSASLARNSGRNLGALDLTNRRNSSRSPGRQEVQKWYAASSGRRTASMGRVLLAALLKAFASPVL
jgi:hypothetical protein